MQRLTRLIVSFSWVARPIQGACSYNPVPLFLLLLVGFVWLIHSITLAVDFPLNSFYQLLGWRALRAGLLDHILSVWCCQTAHHDGSAGKGSWWWCNKVSTMEGCSPKGVAERRCKGVLERVPALLHESLPCECNGFSGFRGCHASFTGVEINGVVKNPFLGCRKFFMWYNMPRSV